MGDPGASAYAVASVGLDGGDGGEALRHISGEAHCTTRVNELSSFFVYADVIADAARLDSQTLVNGRTAPDPAPDIVLLILRKHRHVL